MAPLARNSSYARSRIISMLDSLTFTPCPCSETTFFRRLAAFNLPPPPGIHTPHASNYRLYVAAQGGSTFHLARLKDDALGALCAPSTLRRDRECPIAAIRQMSKFALTANFAVMHRCGFWISWERTVEETRRSVGLSTSARWFLALPFATSDACAVEKIAALIGLLPSFAYHLLIARRQIARRFRI